MTDKYKNKNKMLFTKNQANCFNLEQAGWKYYNSIRKKAMEQEFSWSGLLISLSIAFFIVIASASALNFINQSITAGQNRQGSANKNIYYLENNIYLSNNFSQAEENIILKYKFIPTLWA